MIGYLGPVLALVATTVLGAITKIPMKLRPLVAVAAGIIWQLFAAGGVHDGVQVHDFVDGVIVGLSAVGLYSGVKNVVEHTKGAPSKV